VWSVAQPRPAAASLVADCLLSTHP
jgi:hypothetical protein